MRTKKRNDANEETRIMAARVDAATLDDLEAYALRKGTTVSELLRKFAEALLDPNREEGVGERDLAGQVRALRLEILDMKDRLRAPVKSSGPPVQVLNLSGRGGLDGGQDEGKDEDEAEGVDEKKTGGKVLKDDFDGKKAGLVKSLREVCVARCSATHGPCVAGCMADKLEQLGAGRDLDARIKKELLGDSALIVKKLKKMRELDDSGRGGAAREKVELDYDLLCIRYKHFPELGFPPTVDHKVRLLIWPLEKRDALPGSTDEPEAEAEAEEEI